MGFEPIASLLVLCNMNGYALSLHCFWPIPDSHLKAIAYTICGSGLSTTSPENYQYIWQKTLFTYRGRSGIGCSAFYQDARTERTRLIDEQKSANDKSTERLSLTGLEPSTPALARLYSTIKLFPPCNLYPVSAQDVVPGMMVVHSRSRRWP